MKHSYLQVHRDKSLENKQRLVKLIENAVQSDMEVKVAARHFGVSYNTYLRWRKELKKETT